MTDAPPPPGRPSGRITSFVYDGTGQSVPPTPEHTTSTVYDGAGRVLGYRPATDPPPEEPDLPTVVGG